MGNKCSIFFITINKFIITLTEPYIDSELHKFRITIILLNILSELAHLWIKYANACYDALFFKIIMVDGDKQNKNRHNRPETTAIRINMTDLFLFSLCTWFQHSHQSHFSIAQAFTDSYLF